LRKNREKGSEKQSENKPGESTVERIRVRTGRKNREKELGERTGRKNRDKEPGEKFGKSIRK